MDQDSAPADLLARYINVADDRLGASAQFATDDFFAPKERMLQATEPEWRAGVYDENGKWMDGWESRRRRGGGHDYCIVKLAAPSKLAVLEIDTRHFTGNFPPFASVEACQSAAEPSAATVWKELLGSSALNGNKRNFFTVQSAATWTHVKLNIFPDGGIARFRAYGTVQYDWSSAMGGEPVDLVAALRGGVAVACSDEHYGSMSNLLLPGRAASMAGGWETRRRRGPGYDWVILRLGHRGRVTRVEIDTAFFKGNFPHQVSIQAALREGDADGRWLADAPQWPAMLEPQYLRADSVHEFTGELRDVGAISHVRVNIHPDGGLSRVRLFGRIDSG
ncbi:MAG TPA: allantoicase [Steroidobacteraceae bacterium]